MGSINQTYGVTMYFSSDLDQHKNDI